MRWLLDEEYDRLIEQAKKEERTRIISIIRSVNTELDEYWGHEDCEICKQKEFTVDNVINKINAQS